jgi:hypothetical protein
MYKLNKLLPILAFILLLLDAMVLPIGKAAALTGSDFSAGNIISGAVFTNADAMSPTDIQNFLTAEMPACDTYGSQSESYYYNASTGEVNNSNGGTWITTTRALYGQRYDTWESQKTGTTVTEAAAPYVCLQSYVENPASGENNLQNPSLSVPGGEGAAQIIYNAAQEYQINPEVILTTLQKEQGLITDNWPWLGEYHEAMGYNCPDTPSGCSGYPGFYQQVNAAASQYRNYLSNPNNYNYVVVNNTIDYNVPADGCSQSSSVNIQNQSTAALYDYTPYQPDANVLANTNATGSSSGPGGSVSGDSCAAYGNRNFWWYFTTWFGSTQTTVPYAWALVSQTMYADSAHTEPFGNSAINIAPGAQAYIEVQARNNGNATWEQSNLHLGTSHPDDRSSTFSNSTWLSPARVQMTQSSVTPGGIATFIFSITAPQATGEYDEYFSLVDDGVTWLNDPGMYYQINVANPRPNSHPNNTTLTQNQTLSAGKYLLSADGSTTLELNSNGALNLTSDSQPTWNNGVSGSSPNLLAMQPDGNLVEYSKTGSVLWSSGTSGNPGAFLAVQPDGNMVIYSSSNTALWTSGTSNTPLYSSVAFYTFTGGTLLPGQDMNVPQGNYHLELQTDGNLVLYNGGKPLWASGTSGQQIANLSMQPDGNLVLYNTSGQAVWSSGTSGNPGAFLALQPDGNLVLYNNSGQAVWNTHTAVNE